MKEIVAAQDLRIGMFVSELDRPWLESPFLMQGFLIEDQETLEQVRRECRFVGVDPTRSVGLARGAAPPAGAVVVEREASQGGGQTPQEARRRPLDFFALLRSLRFLSTQQAAVPEVADREAEAAWFYRYPDRGTRPGRRATAGGAVDSPVSAASARPWVRGELPSPRSGAAPSADDRPNPFAERPSSGLRYATTPRVPLEEELLTALPLLSRAQALLAQIAQDVQSGLNPDLESVRGVVSEMVLSIARNPDALLWLVRLKQTDQYSYDHSLDVAAHVMIFGRTLGLGEESIMTLGTAGMLQDVGKLRLPVRLLQKTGPLSPREYEIFKTHVDYSLQVLSASPHASPLMMEIVRRHHERIDGSGYPAGLRGEAVGLMAEIAGICDVYCAMTRERPYGVAASSQVALDTVRAQRGRGFSDSTVDQFVQCIGLYPVGTLVALNSGEVAVVVAQNRIRRLKPRVMILLGSDKQPNAYPQTLDLLYDPPCATGEPYAIAGALPPGAFGVAPSEFYLA